MEFRMQGLTIQSRRLCRTVATIRYVVTVIPALLLSVAVGRARADDSVADLSSQARESIAADNYKEADELLRKAFVAARATKAPELLTDVQEAQRNLRTLERDFNSIKEARERLAQSPDDPAANTAVGRFYCLAKGDWERGATLLAKGEPGPLRDAAQFDVVQSGNLTDPALVGDAWMKATSESRDGQTRDQLHLRARHWYLQAYTGAADDAERKRIYELLGKTELHPTKVVIYNAHNGPHNDRGTLQCNLVLLSKGEAVLQRRLTLAWARDVSVPTTVRLPKRTTFDQVRIDILTWQEQGGGLAELEVYQGDTNVALGAAASGDSSPEAAFRPDRLTDGNRGGKLDQEGIWLQINGKPGSALIDLNRR